MKKAERSIVDLDPPPPRGDLDKPGHRSWIVASPDGELYHADKEVGKVWWGVRTGRGIYKVDREDSVNDYVDLGPAENDTDMYRYMPDSKRELIYYKKEQELRAYLNSVYAETTTVSKTDSEIYVDYTSGETLKTRSKDVLLVKRTDYCLHKNSPGHWSLRFTKFVVFFPTKFKDLETERTRCVVRHTRNFDEFAKVCHKYQMSRLPSIGGMLNTVINSTQKIEIPYRPPIVTKGNHETVFVRGQFGSFEVLVKKVKKKGDLSSVIDNYRSVNNHESIVTLHACESNAKFYYFAMEECKYSLHDHVAQESYVEMSQASMNIMRTLVAGVAHMHRRRIVHRNLNPKNILVDHDKSTAKICGFGNSILLRHGQPDEIPRDIHAVALVLLFYMSGGTFIFQDTSDVESVQSYENSNKEKNFEGNLDELLRNNRYNYEGYHLLWKILVVREDRLKEAEAVLKHPRFWKAIKRLSLFKDVSDYLREGEPSKDFETDLGKFDEELRDIRNDCNHMRNGNDERSLEKLYRVKNPRLLMNVYDALEPYGEIPKFKRYY